MSDDEVLSAGEVKIELEVGISDYAPEDTSAFDLCLVFPLKKGPKAYVVGAVTHNYLVRIISAIGRKYVYMYKSLLGKELVVLLRGGANRLKTKADQLGISVRLNEENSYLAAFAGDKSKGIARIEIAHREEISPLKPFECIYGTYKMNGDIESLYYRKKAETRTPERELTRIDTMDDRTFFSKPARINIVLHILSDSILHGGASINLDSMIQNKELLSYFPPHANRKARSKLATKLLQSWAPWNIDLDGIRDYFGEQVGYAVAFMQHYVSWLVIPGLLGAGVQLSEVIQWDYNRIEAAAFALVISIWSVLAYEFWKRQEKQMAMKWGTLDTALLVNDETRPLFKGTEIKSYIDGSDILHWDSGSRNRNRFQVMLLFVFVCVVALGAIGVIYFMRALLFSATDSSLSQVVASGVNGLVITMLNSLVKIICRFLCDLENHRTESEYMESLVIKLFTFGFVNGFASFYYLAFGAEYMTGYLGVSDNSYDPTQSLAINLAVILLIRSVLGNFLTLALPWLYSSAVKFYNSPNKCRQTCHSCRWFWFSALKKFVCRYLWCRVDLAYDEDTYEEDEIYQAHLAALEKRREAKKNAAEALVKEPGTDDKSSEEESDVEEEEVNPLNETMDARQMLRDESFMLSAAEKEYRLAPFDRQGMVDHHFDQVLTFGYMTLFVAALPGAVCLGMLTYYLELRGTIWSIFNASQRPIPVQCEDIGLWKTALELLIVLAVCTNAGVVIFTMTTFDGYSDFDRMGIFVGFHYAVFLLQYLVSIAVRDEPYYVSVQRLRSQFIVKKLIDKVPDQEQADPLSLL